MSRVTTFSIGAGWFAVSCVMAIASIPWIVYAVGREMRGDKDAVLDGWTPYDWWAKRFKL